MKTKQIAVDKSTWQKLKLLSLENEKKLGDVIKELLEQHAIKNTGGRNE